MRRVYTELYSTAEWFSARKLGLYRKNHGAVALRNVVGSWVTTSVNCFCRNPPGVLGRKTTWLKRGAVQRKNNVVRHGSLTAPLENWYTRSHKGFPSQAKGIGRGRSLWCRVYQQENGSLSSKYTQARNKLTFLRKEVSIRVSSCQLQVATFFLTAVYHNMRTAA